MQILSTHSCQIKTIRRSRTAVPAADITVASALESQELGLVKLRLSLLLPLVSVESAPDAEDVRSPVA